MIEVERGSSANRDRAEEQKIATAIHECGHAAVCAHFGGIGVPEIWKNTAEKVNAGETAWLGKCSILVEPTTVLIDSELRLAPGILPVPQNWKVLVGMAGLIADYIHDECLIVDYVDVELLAESIKGDISRNHVSQIDVDWMGESWGVSDVVCVLQLLFDRWEEIEFNVKALVSVAR